MKTENICSNLRDWILAIFKPVHNPNIYIQKSVFTNNQLANIAEDYFSLNKQAHPTVSCLLASTLKEKRISYKGIDIPKNISIDPLIDTIYIIFSIKDDINAIHCYIAPCSEELKQLLRDKNGVIVIENR